MSGSTKINAIKQNVRLKQFLGWTVGIALPAAVTTMANKGPLTLLAIIAYWYFCGIVLRGIIGTKIPLFDISFSTIKKQLVAIAIFTALGIGLYIVYYTPGHNNAFEYLISGLVFVLINGLMEPLIWANIYDLAGCRIKIFGYIAIVANILIIYTMFWSKYCRFLPVDFPGNVIIQAIIFGLPVLVYEKSGDITIWSLQHMIYSLAIIFAGGFEILKLIHF
ncbi:MAG: hypothetical protein GX895_01270 [Clostridiales bacterium]|uniref:hypothetical protein n=1 Tax=Clostridium sp. N3C TaxID=1776758 RepID=UPI00092E0C87|nr:hypothetical protein [Clostridium sp. N3C]NLZ47413.1 hypothetical protein [Clostridiales bacterium]SCN24217.1 hypothetical protein N3C_1725 [Clostridium sp. N3C]